MSTRATSLLFSIFILSLSLGYSNTVQLSELKTTVPIVNFTTLDGLPSNETYDVLRDEKGYIWVSTDKGVSRYNGYEFENYSTKDGLLDNTVFNIFEDYQGRIWFAGYNNNLFYWDWNKNEFMAYSFNKTIQENLPSQNKIFDLAIDENDHVFIGTQDAGYYIIDSSGKIIESFNLSDMGVNERTIVFGKKLFSGQTRNYGLKSNSPYTHLSIQVRIEDSIILERDVKSWIQTNDLPKQHLLLTNSRYRSFIVNDSVQLFKQPGLYFNHSNLSFEQYTSDVYYSTSIGYLNWEDNSLFFLGEDLSQSTKIMDVDVKEIVRITGTKDLLMISTYSSGIYLFNVRNKVTNIILDNFKTAAIIPKGDNIHFLSQNRIKDRIVIQGDSAFISNTSLEYPESNYNFYSLVNIIPNKTAKQTSLYSGTVKDENKIYLNNYKRLTIADSNYLQIEAIRLETKAFCILNYKNDILIGTENGILQLNDDYSLSQYSSPKIDVSLYRIQDLKSFGDQLIIATRGNGVFISKLDTVIHLTSNEGLPSNIINQLWTSNQFLWVATNNGIVQFNIQQDSIFVVQRFDISDGVLDNDVRQIEIYNDKIYLGFDDGISIIEPNKKNDVIQEGIKLYLTGVTVNDTLLLNKNNSINLKYYQNNLAFDFIGISSNIKNKISYRYQLIGVDNKFKETSFRSVRYNFLKPGNYQFLLEAKTIGDSWNSPPIKVNIVISKAYWQTIWFKALLAILTLFILFVVIGFYYKGIVRRARIEQEINQLKQEALSAQINPHFVFNSLNSIQSYIIKNEKDVASRYLSKFAKLMRLNFENSKNEFITLSEELETLRMYLDLEKMRFTNAFTYEFEIDEAIDTNTCLFPSLLIQPFLENAIWHGILALNNGTGLIKLQIKIDKSSLIIVISDNGIGINATTKTEKTTSHKSSGIEITIKRISLLNKLKKIKKLYKIIDLSDESNSSSGTEVSFSLPYILKPND